MQFLTSIATRCVSSCCVLPISRSSRIRLQSDEVRTAIIVRTDADQDRTEVGAKNLREIYSL